MSYTAIKELATKLGTTVSELLVLAPQNDPFYAGGPVDLERAAWFAAAWQRFGFGRGVHLRRIHYVLVSQDPPLTRINGKPYANTQECWAELGLASKAARYLALVPVADFEDHRAPPPRIFANPSLPYVSISHERPSLYISVPRASSFVPKLRASVGHQSRYHLEVFVEKSTLNDVLEPVCREHGANLIVGVGEFSITVCRLLLDRADRPARVFYLTDFDPGGQSMPVAAARKIEWLAQGLGADIRLYPLALTPEQVAEFSLPRVPIKESERRRGSFERRHGEGATELDALEALHPGELGRIVSQALAHYRDPDIEVAVEQERRRLQRLADSRMKKIVQRFSDQIKVAREELENIARQADSWNLRQQKLADAINRELDRAARSLERSAEIPEEREAGEAHPLLDTKRGYLEQLEVYKVFQRGMRGNGDAA